MLSNKIIKWYQNNKRELPWRQTKEPYYIWLSEIIMQQTRVDQGLPYYLTFIKKFPSIFDLASASEEEVLRTWQGLGYYSRARNLHFTAKHITNDLKGVFPKTYNSLITLKGVGPYTAAAIASISYNEACAVVDGNVYRVLSRLYEIDTPINSHSGIKEFAKLAQSLVNINEPGDYNQGVMEIGATICLPRNPKCGECPIAQECKAKENNTVANFPIKTKKSQVRHRFFNYLVIKQDTKYYIEKRLSKDIWIGLFEFFLIETENEISDFDEMTKQLPDWLPKNIIVGESTKQIQILSHQKINATFWEIDIANSINMSSINFFSIEELEELPKHRLIERYLFENIQ
jgi:A/G-specific adenine glycosylase